MALAVSVLAPAAATAQTDAQKQKAKEHYEKATRLYDVSKYGEAIEEYQKTYLLMDDPILLFNIAQAYRLWDKPEEAVRFYKNYLRRATNAQNRGDVEKRIADLEKIIEERRRGQTTPPPPPVVPVPPTPPPIVTAPPPTPLPTAPPPAPIAPAPPPVAAAPAGGLAEQAPAPDEPPRRRGRTAAYVLMGSGAALLVAAAISAGVANDKAKKIENLAMAGGIFDPKIEKDGKTANAIAIVTGLTGLAAGVAGGILWFAGRSEPAPAAAAPPRLALFPVAGPGFAGAGAGVIF